MTSMRSKNEKRMMQELAVFFSCHPEPFTSSPVLAVALGRLLFKEKDAVHGQLITVHQEGKKRET